MTYPLSASILSSGPSVLVGRDREQRVLIDRCQRAHQGQGGVLWLAGEAGIGKTALMVHLRAWAESNGFQTLWGRHLGHNQTPPLHGLREAPAGLFGIREEDRLGEVEQKVKIRLEASYPGIAPYYRNIVHFLEPFEGDAIEPLGDKPTEQQQRLYYLLFRLFSAISREHPLILFLDDLHWADALSLDCLGYMGVLLIEQPIWVIGAYRPEESGSAGLRRLLTDITFV